MLKLKVSGYYEIDGRGVFAAVSSLPPEFYEKYYDPQQLVGKEAIVDGIVQTIYDVEKYMTGVSPETPYKLSCAFLIALPASRTVIA
jgi:hypothetical protein